MEDLLNWLNEKKIPFSMRGEFLHIEGIEGKLIDDSYSFVLSDEEYEIIEDEETTVKYVVFKWGTKFYYSDLKVAKKMGEYGDLAYEPTFNELVNVGSYSSPIPEVKFVNLGVHTGYELLNGTGEPSHWVDKAKFLGHEYIGISENNTLAGTLPLQLAAKKKGIKVVHGMTIKVAHDYSEDKEFQDVYDLKIYAINQKGWRNMLNISKFINVDFGGFVPEELLMGKTKGLVAVFPTDGYFNDIIMSGKESVKYLKKYMKKFGDENVYYQIDCTEYEDDSLDSKILKNTKRYFDRFSKILKPVLISDSYYVNSGEHEVKKYLNSIERNSHPASTEQYYKDFSDIVGKMMDLFDSSPDKMDILFEAAENTIEIAEKCSYQIDTGNHKLPKFEVEDPEALYDDLIFEGFQKKVIEKFDGDEEKINHYLDRIQEENDVIKGAGFIDYFLILWDIVRWATEEGILVGPGRGSAGGSLVAYLLGIIEIDPIQYNLLFERFLNKARVSGERAKSADALPDIDVDFEGLRRSDVKRYIENKYGREYVCSIGTYTRLKPKSAIKDFSRVKGVPFNEVNFATKEIPDSFYPTWDDIFKEAVGKPVLKKFVQNNLDIIEVIKSPLMQPKAGSVHPSAVLIVPKEDSEGNPMKIHDWMPVKIMDGQLVSEWEGKYIDAAGFLKEDILGIAQLDKFKYILQLIKKNRGKKVNMNKIPIDKPKVMEYFQNGWNEDVFQFGTSGLKQYSKKVKPDGIEDLISMNALFRPGPMAFKAHDDFADIKHGRKDPEYDYMLQTVTENTFGLYVYQEQIMQAVNVLGGLTLAEADELRTAIKKKDIDKMSSTKQKFLDGAQKQGCSLKEGEKIWDKLNAFSAYGFNRSHSAAYSLMGYWCQYLKVNYPLEFWTGSLNFADEKTEVPDRLSEIQKIGADVTVRPPDINKSDIFFTADSETNYIYWSLTKIKGVGEVAVSEILKARKDSEFFDLEDFISRVPKSKVNKRVVQALIVSGAFDSLGSEEGLEITEVKDRMSIIDSHCALTKCDPPSFLELDKCKNNWYWALKQRELTGFGSVDFKSMVKKKVNVKKFPYFQPLDFASSKFKTGQPWEPEKKGTPATIAGFIKFIKERKTKNGNWMCKIMMECNNVVINVGVFGDSYDKCKESLFEMKQNSNLVAVSGYALNNAWGEETINNELWVDDSSRFTNLNN